MQWANQLDPKDRRVAISRIGKEVTVSTVFLGIDHNFLLQGPPLIFETMVFGGRHDNEQWRWATEEEALAGHVRLVRRLSRWGLRRVRHE